MLAWGTSGASIRLVAPGREEPLTVAWIFGDRPGWSGLRHLTLGFDTGSLASESPLRPLLQAYAAAAGRLPGAVPARAKRSVATASHRPRSSRPRTSWGDPRRPLTG